MTDKKQARYITEKERERILKCQSGNKYEERNLAIVYLGFSTGMRAHELKNLKMYNLFDQEWCLRETCHLEGWQTKGEYGAGSFSIRLKRVRSAMLEYIDYRKKRKNIKLDDFFFITQKRGQFKGTSMPNLIRQIFRDAGIYDASSHSMRRTFATDFSYANPNPKLLQTVLRHKTSAMSLNYVAVNPRIIEDTIDKAFNW